MTSPSAGGPSVIMLIQSSWTGSSGAGKPTTDAINITASSATLPAMR
jgi:hypothetical protein